MSFDDEINMLVRPVRGRWSSPTPVYYWDKLVHYLAYFLLAILALFAFPRANLIGLVVLLTILGGGLEVAQDMMDLGRDGTWLDGLANMLGAMTPMLIWFLYCRMKKARA